MTRARRGSLPGRRSFVTPIVVLLVLVVALTATVLYERQAAVRLSVNRMTAGYDSHHMERGMTEVVAAWLDTLRGVPLADHLGADGHAIDIRVRDGTLIRIFLRDAQGALLDPDAGSPPEDAQEARALLDALAEVAPAPWAEEWLRPVGPLGVSVSTAPREVLEAVVEHAAGGEGGTSNVLIEILSARDDGDGITDIELASAIGSGGFTNELRNRLQELLVVDPSLWLVRVEMTPPRRPGRPPPDPIIYEGYSELERSDAQLGADALMPWRMFLTWERVETGA